MAFALVILAIAFRWREPAGIFLPLHLLAFAAAALGCHSELARRRPAPAALTEFYLFLSLGGLIGGAFVVVLAPRVFDAVLEYPLSIALAAALLPYSGRTVKRGDLALAAIIGAVVLGGEPLARWLDWPLPSIAVAGVLAVLAVAVLARQARPFAFGLCIAVLLLGAMRVPWNDDTIWSRAQFLRGLPGYGNQASCDKKPGPWHHPARRAMDARAVTTSDRPPITRRRARAAAVIRGTQAAKPVHRVGLVGLGEWRTDLLSAAAGRMALLRNRSVGQVAGGRQRFFPDDVAARSERRHRAGRRSSRTRAGAGRALRPAGGGRL